MSECTLGRGLFLPQRMPDPWSVTFYQPPPVEPQADLVAAIRASVERIRERRR